MRILIYSLFVTFLFLPNTGHSQHSVAREWSELLLEGIRNDFARPTVHARNLYHSSIAMYDAWAIYDTTGISETVLLGKTRNGVTCSVANFPMPTDIEAARKEALSYAMYRLMRHRFSSSPGNAYIINLISTWMFTNGYSTSNISPNYLSGSPAMMGNYIAQCIINYGNSDNSNETFNYSNQYYQPVNDPLEMVFPGNPDISDFNRWQPLTLSVFIDQSGNVVPFNTPPFLGPEWGKVHPFSLSSSDLTIYNRNGGDYWVYHDPGPPPLIDTSMVGGMSEEYKWGFGLVAKWGAHLDPSDGVMIDISPAGIGNTQSYPQTIPELRNFYDEYQGGDPSPGRTMNPKTGMPYTPQIVPRGDYARVLAEFWADGPDSETPPGHWFSIFNTVMDSPFFERKYNGVGEVLDPLEYDVKAYLTLGGSMHDCAITAWGIKGWYDYLRPVSAIRGMSELGQSSDPTEMSYHPGGLLLDPGYIEVVKAGDALAGSNNENIGKIKLYTWRGPDFIPNPANSAAGVGWILAEDWYPFQRPTFVSPNFAGYVSGHSTYSRAAAEVLTLLTGDEYFPGGMGTFDAPQDAFLVFEEGPSVDIQLQWATYRDASDQTSLSRIWGGIHPPADDIPGRLMGEEIGIDAFHYAKEYFYNDADNDGFYSFEDCDDFDPMINPASSEICDGLDNNCDGMADEDLPQNTYYLDSDGDSFGDAGIAIMTCESTPPAGYVVNDTDCNDIDGSINPSIAEICDGIDNDCNGLTDDGLQVNTYYWDADNDNYGDAAIFIDTCLSTAPTGYVDNAQDCDDSNSTLNPDMAETCDGIDNDCNGFVDDGLPVNTYYFDGDNDSFGNLAVSIDTCISTPPFGYVSNAQDCNDANFALNPNAVEVCDGIDNDCNGLTDDGLTIYTYYEDNDGDFFGDSGLFIETCQSAPPVGYVIDATDCDDTNSSINPTNQDISDNGIDEDCNGIDFFKITKVYPNPVTDIATIHYDITGQVRVLVVASDSRLVRDGLIDFVNNQGQISMGDLAQGIYVLRFTSIDGEEYFSTKVVKN